MLPDGKQSLCRRNPTPAIKSADGTEISFDPNIRKELFTDESIHAVISEVMENTSIFLPGVEELLLVTGADDVNAAIERCFEYPAMRIVCLKNGSKGSTIYTRDGITDIDLCKINHRYFINVVCFGIDADIGNNDQVVHSKWIPEKQRYNFSLISHFFHYRSRKMRICYDKHTEESFYTTVVVCNGRYYGGGYRVGYHSDLTDGKCELYLIQNMKKIMMAKLIAGMKKGKHETSSYTKKVPITMCRISSDEEISCNVDGEKLTSKDFQIEIIPKGIL